MIREINEREVWVDDRVRFLHLATMPRDLATTESLNKKLTRLEAEVSFQIEFQLICNEKPHIFFKSSASNRSEAVYFSTLKLAARYKSTRAKMVNVRFILITDLINL